MPPVPRIDPTTLREQLAWGAAPPLHFRSALTQVPVDERDAWVDAVFGIDGIPADEPLPRGCVPYLPCSVATLLAVVDHADIQSTDVVVDIGAGIGRAIAFVHALTGASCVGLEIQPRLVATARDLAARLGFSRVSMVEGDVAELTDHLASGTVFLLYCPFSGARLERVLDDLEVVARTHAIRVCCVDLPLPQRHWPAEIARPCPELLVYASG